MPPTREEIRQRLRQIGQVFETSLAEDIRTNFNISSLDNDRALDEIEDHIRQALARESIDLEGIEIFVQVLTDAGDDKPSRLRMIAKVAEVHN